MIKTILIAIIGLGVLISVQTGFAEEELSEVLVELSEVVLSSSEVVVEDVLSVAGIEPATPNSLYIVEIIR